MRTARTDRPVNRPKPKPLNGKGLDSSDGADGMDHVFSTDRPKVPTFAVLFDRFAHKGRIYQPSLIAALAREGGIPYRDAKQMVEVAIEGGRLRANNGAVERVMEA